MIATVLAGTTDSSRIFEKALGTIASAFLLLQIYEYSRFY
jgi:hypothetical protein